MLKTIKIMGRAESIPPLRTWTARAIPKGARVLVRVDANVPVVHGRAEIGPSGRIARSIPELKKLLRRDARIILMTHFGRPSGVDPKFSVAPLAQAFAALLGRPVSVAGDVVGRDAAARAAALAPGEILMLENLRFEKAEEDNDAAFARKLAALADVYVNNAFGVCHRTHASVVAITKHLPSFAGELLMREVDELTRPVAHPFVLVVGGIKLETKLPLLQRLGAQADKVLIGSALVDELARQPKLRKTVHDLLGEKLVVPPDLRRNADRHAYDVGPKTVAMLPSLFAGAATIIWNGPLGITEHAAGRRGTAGLVRAIVAAEGARTIVGGGETIDVVEDMDAAKKMSWVSTGGGAMLALLAGEKLPGITALHRSHDNPRYS